MFYLKAMVSYRNQEFELKYPHQPIGHHYIFDEETGDIENIHGIPYQYYGPKWGQIDILKLMATKFVPDLLIMLMIQLQKSLKYKGRFHHSPLHFNNERQFFMGHADIVLKPAKFISPTISLLPSFDIYNQIWVKDITYKKSKKFFIESFAPNLWLSFLGMFMAFFIVSLLLTKLVSYYKNRIDTFDVVALILNQSVENMPTIWSYKILIFALALLLIIFFGGYDAFLSSLLAVRKMTLPFHDKNSLFTQNEYVLCLSELDLVHEIEEFDKYRTNSYKVKLNTNDCPSLDDMRKLGLYRESYALDELGCEFNKIVFITSGRARGFRQFSRHCNIAPLPGKYITQNSGIICYPGFKYRKIINRMLILFRTAGVLHNDFTRSETRLNIQEPLFTAIDSDLASITFYQVHLIVTILLVGYAMSLISLAIERIRLLFIVGAIGRLFN